MEARHPQSLAGQFLLAMPGIDDDRFERAVILILSHDKKGAMGFIINRPADELTLGTIIENLPKEIASTGLVNMPIFVGGPVENDHGFVLHSQSENKDPAAQHLVVSQTLDILFDAAQGKGPDFLRLFLGYASWSAGQLENEIQDNIWLIAPADPALIFSSNPDDLYERVARRMGIDLMLLSSTGGEA